MPGPGWRRQGGQKEASLHDDSTALLAVEVQWKEQGIIAKFDGLSLQKCDKFLLQWIEVF